MFEEITSGFLGDEICVTHRIPDLGLGIGYTVASQGSVDERGFGIFFYDVSASNAFFLEYLPTMLVPCNK